MCHEELGKVVEYAKQSTVIFNNIDVGDHFDLAIQSLCLRLELPLISGGTFSGSMMIDYFPPKGKPCCICVADGMRKDMIEMLHPSGILELPDILFVPKDDHPIG